MTEGSETILRVVRDESLARDWELVLLAQGLSPRVRHTFDGIVLTVPRHEVDRALAGLAAYEKENLSKAQPPDGAPAAIELWAGVVAGLAVIAFFAVTVAYTAVPWLERGSAKAADIIQGELWRAVTALTLHGDVAHALSNAVAMAVFFAALSSQLGGGVAAALVLASGALGNLANAYLHGAPHNAVGASTGVFGAVGMLGGLALVRRRRSKDRSRRAWITLAASLALLGMLGSSGARVDVMAHLLGLLSGGLLGIAVALFLPLRSSAVVQWSCGAVTGALILYCWTLAL